MRAISRVDLQLPHQSSKDLPQAPSTFLSIITKLLALLSFALLLLGDVVASGPDEILELGEHSHKVALACKVKSDGSLQLMYRKSESDIARPIRRFLREKVKSVRTAKGSDAAKKKRRRMKRKLSAYQRMCAERFGTSSDTNPPVNDKGDKNAPNPGDKSADDTPKDKAPDEVPGDKAPDGDGKSDTPPDLSFSGDFMLSLRYRSQRNCEQELNADLSLSLSIETQDGISVALQGAQEPFLGFEVSGGEALMLMAGDIALSSADAQFSTLVFKRNDEGLDVALITVSGNGCASYYFGEALRP